jgi:hypothetical protein
LKNGASRATFAQEHSRNQTNSRTIDSTIARLKEDLDFLTKNREISIQDMQVKDQKIQKIMKLHSEIKSKLNMSEAEILDEGRNELIAGGKAPEQGENEDTRGLSNPEMLQTFEEKVDRV